MGMVTVPSLSGPDFYFPPWPHLLNVEIRTGGGER
jgi:hypothetical protein